MNADASNQPDPVNSADDAFVNGQGNAAGPGEIGGRVIPLRPGTRSADSVHRASEIGWGTQVEPVPVNGEVLSPGESAELDRRLPNGPVRDAGPVRLLPAVRGAVTAVTKAAHNPKTMVVIRVTVLTLQGGKSWALRAYDAGTMGVYRRQIRAAEAAGDMEGLRDWTERREAAIVARHQRFMDLPKLAFGVVKVVIGSLVGLIVTIVVVAAVVHVSGAGTFAGVVDGVLDFVRFMVWLVTAAWTPVLLGAPLAVLYGAYREGRRRGTAPRWLATSAESDVDLMIDETTVAAALAALRIPQVTQYLKGGSPLQYLTPLRVDGRGTHCVIRLPAGVTADKVARRRADLAAGLHRLAKEVYPSTGSEEGILDLWIADKGALAAGAGEYPLLEEGLVDVFKGVPFGRSLRGEPILAPVMERNTIVGGMPGQGKSSGARVIMAGAALDPTAELRIWVPDANFDFEVFKPRCSRYVMGAEDERIGEILEQLRELHAEVQHRGAILVEHEEPQVNRKLASAGIGLHPLFCLLEEAHVAIQHPEYGTEIAKLLVDIVRLGRKRGIHVIVSTQAPTKDSMPRDVTRNCSNGIAFAVGDHVANDALLGQGAYAAGHRATELIPGTDRGTAVVKGFAGESRSQLAQAYFLSVAKGNDQVTPIIERALAAIRATGRVPGADRPAPQGETNRDLLEDLDTVLGDDPVRAADVPALLSRLAPGWAPYRTLTGKALVAELAAQGVKVPSTGNKYPVDPVTVREALAKRATADLDGDD
ncbi:FtsK/SpoIIIE domain-containing protein [Actinokineospora iranica]|uniref:DNA segregation ATPase FtsK/SpoIIIE, S-DNA-T family n=1 Tax=Actinokineospora iranica TaxID=1271860 RepID=A0A1G6WQV4_9PSEU|nr:cell division protein FtsK [Actinokineospora iranica]SDD68238.1 DNA segregation ATPase FtsK/SpoIIIE, S-DNA-T family [Actinokineospora iranica]